MKSMLFVSATLLLALTGCSESVETLAEDHERRNEILKSCADLGVESQDDALCRMAAKAQIEAAKRSIQGAFNE